MARLGKIPYSTIRELLRAELLTDEEPKTAELIKQLRHVGKDRRVSRKEFVAMCRWKSRRPLRHYLKNSERKLAATFSAVLSTRSERRRLALLTGLDGVSIPTASAILMLINPRRYGVIDIRVWQLLYAMGSVSKRPSGQNFGFKDWYHYLRKLRYFAQEFKVPVRCIERTLFEYHRRILKEPLYAKAAATR